jgi:hypothetical protein
VTVEVVDGYELTISAENERTTQCNMVQRSIIRVFAKLNANLQIRFDKTLNKVCLNAPK